MPREEAGRKRGDREPEPRPQRGDRAGSSVDSTAAQAHSRSAPAESGPWTTRRLIRWMTDRFAQSDLDSPRLCAELLLSHVLGCDRLRLYTEADRPATPLERQSLRDLVTRALAHEPVQYLVGEAWFFSLPFAVDPRVLIPRPSSETIVEQVLQDSRARHGRNGGLGLAIADICTGSGCIAVAILKNLAGARAVATEISATALEVARASAVRHGVLERLDLIEGDLLTPLASHPTGRGLHYLVSNPPYIPDNEWASIDPAHAVGRNVKGFEPESALRGGPDGLRYVRPLIEHGPAHLLPDGLLMVELASSCADAALGIARANGSLADARIIDDFEGMPRVLVARRT